MDIPSNVFTVVLWVLGGLALFLYGIDMMGRALRKAAGNALRAGLHVVTRTRFRGLFTGAIVTGLLQSSSAATVMIVGFIGAGLMAFPQSIGLILGANIGTTLTPQITAFKIDSLALPLLGIGFVINFFARKRFVRELGLACMGFGMLFFGMVLMKFAVSGYTDVIRGWLESCVSNGLAGEFIAFGIAVAVTLVIQSSAATIAMLQALALQGAFTHVELAIPIIIGADIGTCITAILASLKAPRSAKRAAFAHLAFNVIGALITAGLFGYYVEYIPRTAETVPHQIANCHLAIKCVNVALFLPFTGLFAKFIVLLTPGEDVLSAAPKFLNHDEIGNAEKALENVKKEIHRMCLICLDMINDAVTAFFDGDEKVQHRVLQSEELVDDLYKSIAGYVVEVSEGKLPPDLSSDPALLMSVMSDAERIGDHAENIVELSQAFKRGGARLSGDATEGVKHLLGDAMEIGRGVAALFDNPDSRNILPLLEMRKRLNVKAEDMIRNHKIRLVEGECTVIAGIIFVDLITNLRRVVNHLRSIAAALGDYPVKHDRAEV